MIDYNQRLIYIQSSFPNIDCKPLKSIVPDETGCEHKKIVAKMHMQKCVIKENIMNITCACLESME